MKAIFSPGPSYSDPKVREAAGWVSILDLYRDALAEMDFDVFLPQVPNELIEQSSTVAKMTSYDLAAALQLPLDSVLFLGPPGYSLAQIMRLRGRESMKLTGDPLGEGMESTTPRIMSYVWNNSDWWRDCQLLVEYERQGAPYDLSPAWRFINKKALELSDHVLACSPWVKKTHAELVPAAKISIAFWGVDSKRFHPPAQEPDVFRVLFVGGDPIRKGLVYLLRALQEVDVALDPYEFWLVGSRCIDDVPSHWRQFGLVPHEQMPDLYRQCSVLICPTLEDGIALCVQEAMASGLVPIGTPEVAEVFASATSVALGFKTGYHQTDRGFVVGYRNPSAIASALQILKHNPLVRREMARAARALAETQTWANTKHDFKKIVRRVMVGGALPFESPSP